MGPFTKSRVLRGGTTCAIVVYQPYLVKEKWAFPAAWRVKEIAQATVRGAPPLLTLVLQPAQPSCDRRLQVISSWHHFVWKADWGACKIGPPESPYQDLLQSEYVTHGAFRRIVPVPSRILDGIDSKS